MSGLPLLDLLGLDKYPVLNEGVRAKLNELLDKFPEPPSATQQPAPVAAFEMPAIPGSSWLGGGIRAVTGKFNIFKSS